jgi:hypothetical protein
MHRLLTLLLFGLAASTTVQAGAYATGTLPYQHVADVRSQPGESVEAFLYRLIPVFRAWADKTGAEACAELGRQADGIYGVVIGSNHSHIGCLVYRDKVLPGMQPTGQTVHTHGVQRQVTLNAADFKLLALQGNTIYIAAEGRPRISGQSVDRFSTADYADSPGYLITPTRVLFQNGPYTSRVVTP